MRAQDDVVLDVEGVLRVARRVVLREIEQLEVVVVVLDLRALDHVKAHAGEHVDQLILHEGDRVHAAQRRVLARFGDVDGLACELLFLLELFDFAVQRVELRGELFAHLVDHLAGLRAHVRGELAHRAQQHRQVALLAQQLQAQRVKTGLVADRFERSGGLFLDFAQLLLHIHVVISSFFTEKSLVRKRDEAEFLVVPPNFRLVRRAQ